MPACLLAHHRRQHHHHQHNKSNNSTSNFTSCAADHSVLAERRAKALSRAIACAGHEWATRHATIAQAPGEKLPECAGRRRAVAS